MAVCCCSLAGTAACQHCSQNPFATDIWTNKTVMVDHVEVKPFGNGIDVCPVCGKPSTIGKPITNADRIRSMTDEEIANYLCENAMCDRRCPAKNDDCIFSEFACRRALLDWLKQEAEEGET